MLSNNRGDTAVMNHQYLATLWSKLAMGCNGKTRFRRLSPLFRVTMGCLTKGWMSPFLSNWFSSNSSAMLWCFYRGEGELSMAIHGYVILHGFGDVWRRLHSFRLAMTSRSPWCLTPGEPGIPSVVLLIYHSDLPMMSPWFTISWGSN